MPTYWRRQIERVRNDGQILYGDRADMDVIQCRTDTHKWVAPPRLILERWSDAGKPPVIPGWKFHPYSGIGDPSRIPTPGNPVYITCLEYTPIECNDPNAKPVKAPKPKQLTLF